MSNQTKLFTRADKEELQAYLDKFENALLSLDRLAARQILSEIMGRFKKEESFRTLEGIIVPIMEKIGEGWEKGDVALSQVYMSGCICETLVKELMPAQAGSSQNGKKIAIAVLEDYHLLGKRMVKSVLLASGFDLIDYGTKTAAELASSVIADGVEILLVSTLMLPSAMRVKELRRILADSGNAVKIIVGGAPFRFDKNLWKEVGADATGNRATEAVSLIHKMMEGKDRA
ncbi:MAG: cobalamin-dependent protein [Nitrospinae bacterium]|nr:cobalamin-dependent protein [Nitrospinota bacterium]MBF0633152.1 cobalamin-dependent protein [Nitrospinota bacterium]